MAAGRTPRRFRVLQAAATAALFAAPAPALAAPQTPPFRAGLFTPPAVVDLTGLAFAPTRAPLDDPAFSIDEPVPVAAILDGELRARPREPDSLDLAWSLMSPDIRDLALALDSWTNEPDLTAERRRIRAALANAYAARGFAPFWIEDGQWRPAAAPALARLAAAGDDGLDLRAYVAPAADRAAPTAEDDLALSESVAAYALQARGARIEPERISRLIGAQTTLPDPAQAVADVADSGESAGDMLQGFNPTHYGYQQLREKLIEMRAQRAAAPASDETFAAIVDGVAQTDALPPASKSKRRRAAVVAKASTSRVEAEIIANMERWRWLPRDLGEERVEVNIPDFELALVRNGEVAHRTRIIVGKEETPTPIFSNALQFIIVNPYWNVPPSILNKEMLPKAGGDVSAIAARGFNVSYRGGKLVVRQPPGEGNALGRIKFMFPNDFAVYLHDTPTRNLFAASHRAFSHGCMRVQEPFALAEAVLGPGSGWSESRVRRLIGGSERYINLSKPLPIHIEYFTAYVDESGRLVQRPDLYGYSGRVRRALGLGG